MKMGEIVKGLVGRNPDDDQRRGATSIEGGRRDGEHENPYLAARRTWNDQSAANVASRQMFQLLGVLALLVLIDDPRRCSCDRIAQHGLINPRRPR